MSSKNISIREDVYQRLKRRKREDESFSDVLERLIESDRDLTAGFGAWQDTDRRAELRAVREELDADLEEGIDTLRRRREEDA